MELQSAYTFNPLRLFNLISLAKPAGVGLQLYAFPTTPFTYSDALLPGGGPNGEVVDALLGFGDATDGGTTGGEFATIIGDAI